MIGPLLAVLLLMLAAAAALTVNLLELGRVRDTLIAGARAIVQLAGVSLVIGIVRHSLRLTATSLTGRRTVDELTVGWGEYEAALSIGLLRRDAVILWPGRPPHWR